MLKRIIYVLFSIIIFLVKDASESSIFDYFLNLAPDPGSKALFSLIPVIGLGISGVFIISIFIELLTFRR